MQEKAFQCIMGIIDWNVLIDRTIGNNCLFQIVGADRFLWKRLSERRSVYEY